MTATATATAQATTFRAEDARGRTVALYTLPLDGVRFAATAANPPAGQHNALRCFTCGGHDLSTGVFNSAGTLVCFGCGLKYEDKGIAAELLLSDAQRAPLPGWAGVEVGAN